VRGGLDFLRILDFSRRFFAQQKKNPSLRAAPLGPFFISGIEDHLVGSAGWPRSRPPRCFFQLLRGGAAEFIFWAWKLSPLWQNQTNPGFFCPGTFFSTHPFPTDRSNLWFTEQKLRQLIFPREILVGRPPRPSPLPRRRGPAGAKNRAGKRLFAPGPHRGMVWFGHRNFFCRFRQNPPETTALVEWPLVLSS